jgi:hypothetical protein
MKLISFKLSACLRHQLITHKGYLDPEDYYWNLVFINIYLFNKILIWKYIVFKEDVPQFHVIKQSCFGYNDFKSKRPKLLNAAIKKKTIKTIRL